MSIKQTFKRSFYKTMTWRVVASLDTALLTWLFSGNIVTGLKVGGMEIVTKLIIYFLHERAWRVGWNKQSDKFHDGMLTKNHLVHFTENIGTRLLPTFHKIISAHICPLYFTKKIFAHICTLK